MERPTAEVARETMAALILGGEVTLTNIRYDRYGGHVAARVAAPDSSDTAR